MTVSGIYRILLVSFVLGGTGTASAQTIADGADNPAGTTFTTRAADRNTDENYPAGVWAYDTTTSYDMVDSVRTTLPDKTYSILDAEIQGPAVLTFRWKATIEELFDKLGFSSQSASFSVRESIDWQQRTVELDCGTNDVRWYLDRNATTDTGLMSAWIDDVVVTPIPPSAALQEALDNTTMSFYSQDWILQSSAGSHDGDHATNAPMADGQESSIMMEIEGPAVVTFSWGLSGEEFGYSQFALSVDGSQNGRLQGDAAVSERTLNLGPGTHCLKFEYYQDYPLNSEDPYTGAKAAILDNFQVTRLAESPSLASALERDRGVFSNDWQFQVFDSVVGTSAASVTAPETDDARFMYVDLPDEAGLLSFYYKTQSDADLGYLFVDVDGEEVARSTGQTEWQKAELNMGEGSDRFLEAVFIRFGDLNGGSVQTRALLDNVKFLPGETNYRPDLTIKAKGSGLKGRNVYSVSPARQRAVAKTDDRRPYGIYPVKFQNDCPNYRDVITIRGTRSNRHFETFFLLRQDDQVFNFSAALFTGRLQTRNLDPGASEGFELQVGRKRRSSKRSRSITIRGTSQADASKVDVVQSSLKIKRFRFRR
jgi:hypothetical protein